MVRTDILGGLKNALERGESFDEAKNSLVSAGYPKSDVEEAALTLTEKIQKKKSDMPIPTIYSTSLQAPPAPPASTSETEEKVKPLPQIKVKAKFNYLLIVPIVLISALIAYLIYNIFLSQ